MKDLLKILKIVFEYKKQAFTSIFFNILFVIFGLISISATIPFLDVLFNSSMEMQYKTESTVERGSENAISMANEDASSERVKPVMELDMDYLLDLAEYYISGVIEARGTKFALMLICAFMIVSTFLKTSSRYVSVYFMAPVRNGVMKTLRNSLFKKLLRLPLSYYSEERKGDIISRMSSDVQEVEISVISTFEVVFKDPFIILFNLFALITISWELTIFVLIMLPISGLLIGRIGKKLKRSARKGQKRLGLLISIIEESISGLRIIKAFNNENRSYSYFQGVNNHYTRIMTALYRRRGLAGPLSEFLGTIVMVVVVWYGSSLVISASSDLMPEKLIGFILLFYMIINPAKQVSTAFYSIQKGMASIDRINGVLNAPLLIVDKPNPKRIENFTSTIEFKNVGFKYDKDMVLQNIDLTIPKGKTIALVGQSGSGKSTLADLIPRFIDVIEGEVTIDGVNLKEYKTTDVRALMGIVTQESILFNDSVFNNIAYGIENATEEDVINAAKVANAHEFIVKMKHGYYTNIGDMGHKLSGGQKQRLSIARAVMKNPPILILDEATSALDTESEKLVQDALFSLMKNRTSVVIAHRLSTIQTADEILVMENGHIVERGKHNELIQMGGVYNRLVELQNFN